MANYYDMHAHTTWSHDARQTPEELCRAAVETGLKGVAFTDHSDTPYALTNGQVDMIAHSVQHAARLAAQHAGQLTVLRGVEIGEELWGQDAIAAVRSAGQYDVILGSVHGFRRQGRVEYYSAEPFDAAHYTDSQLMDFFRRYLYDLGEMALATDYDILTHPDCPLRYINGKFGRELDITPVQDLMDEVLRTVIRRGKTLEANTSGLASPWGKRMPDDVLLHRYKELGGVRICLSSDAHTSSGVAAGFAPTAAFLQQLGLQQTIYIDRKPITVPWN